MNQAEAEDLFGRMLDGGMDDAEISSILIEMADRGETAEEVAGAVRAMQARMIAISGLENAIDVCGTGGDGQHSLNVSTAVALVVAACGVPVAKHGNRAASSKAGTADTLEALGLDLVRAGELASETLPRLNIAFFFAQKHHPALARIAPIRKALGRRTIFNLLGPLANPAGVTRQLVGVASPSLLPLYREAMELLDVTRAMIVSGEEGLDEISISGPSRIASIGIPGVAEKVVPEDAGLSRHPAQDLRGGEAEFNAVALRRMLQGEQGAYRDAVLLNAAGALIVADRAAAWRQGVDIATHALDAGLANSLLDNWISAVK